MMIINENYFHHCSSEQSQSLRPNNIRVINHLIFDFDKQNLQVEIFDKELPKCACKYKMISRIFKEYLTSFQTPNSKEEVEQKEYTVNISPLINQKDHEKGFEFNHAGCQCFNPTKSPFEAFQIQHYPFLDHIHLLTVPHTNGKSMFVYVVYNAIIAL